MSAFNACSIEWKADRALASPRQLSMFSQTTNKNVTRVKNKLTFMFSADTYVFGLSLVCARRIIV